MEYLNTPKLLYYIYFVNYVTDHEVFTITIMSFVYKSELPGIYKNVPSDHYFRKDRDGDGVIEFEIYVSVKWDN